MIRIPAEFSKVILSLHGQAGKEWLSPLAGHSAYVEERWGIRAEDPLQPLAYSYVVPATTPNGTKLIIKLAFPDSGPLREAEVLRRFGGRASVLLLDAETAVSALLLERLIPGSSLSTVEDDEEATSIAVGVIRRLGAPVPEAHSFRTVADRAGDLCHLRNLFGGGTGPFPGHLVRWAEGLFKELLASMGPPVLLHGDLHHDNILSAEREPWVAIDPKGIVGEPAYEVAILLCNPMPGLLARPNPLALIRRRIDQLAEGLGFDRERIAGWGIAQAVLSSWWAYEDHEEGWEYWIRCAELIRQAGRPTTSPSPRV